MKKTIIFILFVLLAANIFPEKVKTLKGVNIYGGETIEITIDKKDIETEKYSKMTQYYDNEKNIVKVVAILAPSIVKERGIIEQINYYKDKNIVKYEMKYSKAFQKNHDYNRVVEEVGDNEVIVRTIWYRDNDIIDVIDYPEDTARFQFYTMQYIEKELQLVLKETDGDNNSIVISAKYDRIRSLVKFDTKMFDLEKEEITLIQHLGMTFGNDPNFQRYYRKKVQVYSGNKKYWLFVQIPWEDQVKGQEVTIKYYPVLWKKQLYIMGIGFFEIQKDKPSGI